MTALLAAALAAAALALTLAPQATGAAGLGIDPRSGPVRGWVFGAAGLVGGPVVVALGVTRFGGGGADAGVGWAGRAAGPGVVLLAAGSAVLALRQAGRRRVVRRDTASRVLEACEEIAGELSAGVAPGQALGRAAVRWPVLAPVASAHRFGTSVPEALRALTTRPGAGDLALVAGAWQLAERSGAGLAVALGSVADGLRQQQRTRRVVAAELSSARATARLIAGLPALTLATGSGIGSPVGFLFGTGVGLLCLGGGLGLGFLGLAWIEQIAVALEQET
jgi:tight adherence protein B